MLSFNFKNLAMMIGVIYVILITLIDHHKLFWVDYLYTTCLGLYYYRETGSFNGMLVLLFALSCAMETQFIFGFEENYTGVMVFAILVFILLCIMLVPLARETKISFKDVDLISSILGTVGMGYVLGYLVHLLLPLVPEPRMLILAIVPFCTMMLMMIFIPVFNTKINNFNLVITGGAILVLILSACITEFLFESYTLLLSSYLGSLMFKIVFVIFLINRFKQQNENLEEPKRL
ncbi:MAG: hypothetical protein CL868_03305 [Cytophagaceae bacterium]|nr:hypothetical protein [Cytophagaceae bacterium]|tara:strand:- start:585 stop:1286 length:702 start_codon:yes stop_codon:yes gene_type:complete